MGLVVIAFAVPVLFAAPPLVTTGADNTTVDGLCSLREAILSANGTPINGDCATGINITFDPLVTTVTINSGAPLPDITANGIVIDGQNTVTIAGAAGAGDGLTIRASNVRISRLALGGFPGNGIVIRGTNTQNVTLNALKVGFDSINTPLGNGVNGLLISNGAHDNNIGLATAGGIDRNTFSNNGQHGIEIRGRNDPDPALDTRNNVIIANNIGVSPDGTLAAANQDNGIVIIDGANSNTIGGGSSDERNVISFNPGDGVSISGARTINNTLIGNSIGGDFNGTGGFPNANGVRLSNNANNNTIGTGNFIVFNTTTGIIFEGNALNNLVDNNTISQNGTHGILLTGAANNNRLQNNTINQNGANGIVLTGASTNNTINNNTISQNTTNGVAIDTNGTNNNRIRLNTITNNLQDGVVIQNTAVGNFINRNIMGNNGQLGIDLGNDGVTANDLNDPDNGPNNLQNFPQSLLAVDTGTETLLAGVVNSTVNLPFRVEAFTTTDNQEGMTFQGNAGSVNNNTQFTISMPSGLLGQNLVTTASSSINSTSEFSPIVTVFQLQANFTAAPLTGNFPLLVNFTDTSLNTTGLPLSYEWNYGDGSAFDSIANPSHTFTAPGTYTVTLTVCVSNGVVTVCDDFSLDIVVTGASPTPTTTPSQTPIVQPSTFTPTFTPNLSATPTVSPTITLTPSRTLTFTRTPSITLTPSLTRTPTFTRTLTFTRTPSLTRTFTQTPSVTATFTLSVTPSLTRTLPPTVTTTIQSSNTVIPTIDGSLTPIFTFTPSNTVAPIVVYVSQLSGLSFCQENAGVITCAVGTLPGVAITPIAGVTGIPTGQANPQLTEPYIRKSSQPAFARPGDPITYFISVINPTQQTFTGLRVTDTMPDAVEIESASADSGSVQRNGQNIVYTLATLPANGRINITITGRLKEGEASPQIVNRACMTTAQNAAPRCAEWGFVRARTLPLTGEAPVLPLVIAGLGGLMAVGIGGVIVVQRRIKKQATT